MREYIIADNQDITKAGMMFLLSKQKEVSLLLEADNKMELVQLLRIHPQAVVILDYTLFDFSGADELIILQERFKESDWLLFSDELSIGFLRQVLFSSNAFGVVLKDNSKEEIMSALQCASRKERFICNHVSNLLLSGSGNVNTASAVHTAGRPSAHTDGKNNLKRNSFRQNDQRDSGREASEFSYHQQSPKKYIPQTGSEQCARGYQICHAGRHCGSGGILYLKQKSVPEINPNTPIHTDLEQRPIIKPHLCINRCHLKELSLYSYPISPLPKQTRDSAS